MRKAYEPSKQQHKLPQLRAVWCCMLLVVLLLLPLVMCRGATGKLRTHAHRHSRAVFSMYLWCANSRAMSHSVALKILSNAALHDGAPSTRKRS